jgi:hypothetical protein
MWNGWEVTAGGLSIEGARPCAAARFLESGEVRYTLTNSDSRYTRPIGNVDLSTIASIQTLDRHLSCHG